MAAGEGVAAAALDVLAALDGDKGVVAALAVEDGLPGAHFGGWAGRG